MKALQAEGLSQRRACSLVKCPRRTAQYRSLRAPEDPKLIEQVKELAERWPRFGYRRLMIMLRRKDITLSWWHLRRVYGQLSLQVRPRRKRHVRYIRGNTVAGVSRPNERWSVDFIHDRLALGRPIRAMVVVDDFTRECLAIEVGFSFGSRDVIRDSRAFRSIAISRRRCGLIEEASSRVERCCSRAQITKSLFSSPIPESLLRMLRLKRSTAESGTNFSTSTASPISLMPEQQPKSRVEITKRGRTSALDGKTPEEFLALGGHPEN